MTNFYTLLFVLILTGCATNNLQHTNTQEDNLIQKRGNPTVRTTDMEGNTVYIYANQSGQADVYTIGLAGTILFSEKSPHF